MKTIEEAAIEHAKNLFFESSSTQYLCKGDFTISFIEGVEFAQCWISVDELPKANIQDDEGIFYSEYLLLKVKGYEHPFVGYYVKANDDEFFDFIQDYIQRLIPQEDITHWRPIEYK